MLGKTGNPSEPDHLSVLVCNSVQLGTPLQGLFNIRHRSNFPELADEKQPSRATPVCPFPKGKELTQSACVFYSYSSQNIPGSVRLHHTGDSTVDVTNMASAVQERVAGLGNSDADLINLDAKSDLFQTKQKL